MNLQIEADDVRVVGDGAEATALDGGGVDRVLTSSGVEGLLVEDLTLTGGLGGAWLFDTVAVLEAVNITDNRCEAPCEHGAGLLAEAGELTLRDAALSGNTAEGDDARGGGLYLYSNGADMDRVTLSGNAAGLGGGMALNNGFVTIVDSAFLDNTASGDGGGVWMETGFLYISTTDFDGNAPDPLYHDDNGASYFVTADDDVYCDTRDCEYGHPYQ